ncbi:hypothetical protein WME99_20565 [Sorangium sp. So ce136]|uniref:hypothetical protein n=1 Tax=Sorangium sp. So ce136 TaxID=3133284 RepID=UPI003F05DF1C
MSAIHVTLPSCAGAVVVDELPGCGPGRSRPGCWEPCPAGCDVEAEGLVVVLGAAEAGFCVGVLLPPASPVLGEV